MGKCFDLCAKNRTKKTMTLFAVFGVKIQSVVKIEILLIKIRLFHEKNALILTPKIEQKIQNYCWHFWHENSNMIVVGSFQTL